MLYAPRYCRHCSVFENNFPLEFSLFQVHLDSYIEPEFVKVNFCLKTVRNTFNIPIGAYSIKKCLT